MGADVRFQGVAPRREVGKRRGQFGKHLLRIGERGLGFADAAVDAAAQLDLGLDLVLERGLFGAEARECDIGVG